MAAVFWLLDAKREDVENYFNSTIGSPTEQRYLYYYFQRYFHNARDVNLAIDPISQEIMDLENDLKPSEKLNGIDYLIFGGDGEKHTMVKSYKQQ